MTTITFRDNVMAADGRETISGETTPDGYIVRDNCKKIFRLTDGSLFAGHGVSEDVERVRLALEDGRKKMPKSEDCMCIRVKPDGSLWCYEGRIWTEITDMPYYALGSGAPFALSAMDTGADAQTAVRVAISRDVWSGGVIQVEPLKP